MKFPVHLPLLTLVLAAAPGCKRAAATGDASPPPARVTTSEVEFPAGNPQAAFIQTAPARPARAAEQRLTGRLAWDEDVTNRVFSPLAGRVEKILAPIGTRVAKGDDLALLRSPDFGQAQADARKALSDFTQAERTLARVKALSARGAAAQKDLEAAQADFDRFAAERQRTELRLSLFGRAGSAVDDLYHVVAPIAGIVVDRRVNVGQEVRSDIVLANTPELAAPMFTITDPSRLWLVLDVPEAQLGRLRVGQTVELATGAYPGRVFPGRVELIGSFLNPQSRVAQARASVPNPDGLLKAEMYVSVKVREEEASPEATEVPAKAVLFVDGKYYVFVETSPRRFARREVTLARAGAETTTVRGLAPGQRVAAEGSLLLQEMLLDEPPSPSPSPKP